MHPRLLRLSFILFLTLAVFVGGCISSGPSPAAWPRGAPSAAPSSVASAGASGPTGSGPASDGPDTSASASNAGTGSQSDSEWGRIWDDVPQGFPIYPGSTLAGDTSPEPVSATYAVAGGDDPAQIASWMQSALETATFSTESLSGPLEDGSYVLDSVGDGECRIQVVIAPMGGLTFVTVRYGAGCSAG